MNHFYGKILAKHFQETWKVLSVSIYSECVFLVEKHFLSTFEVAGNQFQFTKLSGIELY